MNKIFCFLGLILIFNSCTSDGIERKTKRGNKFFMHKDVPGPVIQEGEVAFCSLQRWLDDSLELTTAAKKMIVPFTMLKSDEITKENLAMDVISMLSAGDSVSTYQLIDSFTYNMRPDTKGKSFLMTIKVDSIGKPGSSEAYMIEKSKLDSITYAFRISRKQTIRDSLTNFIKEFQSKKFSLMAEMKNGVYIKKLVEGKGKKVGPSNIVRFELVTMFEDNSYLASTFVNLNPDQIIPYSRATIAGIEYLLDQSTVGDEFYAFIPSSMAYLSDGDGIVPPNTNLMVYMQILDVIPTKRSDY